MKNMEEILKNPDSAHLYKGLLEAMEDGAAILTDQGVIIYCNSGFSKMINHPKELTIGNKFAQFLADKQSVHFSELLQAAMHTPVKGLFLFNNNLTNDRQQEHLIVSVSPLIIDHQRHTSKNSGSSGLFNLILSRNTDKPTSEYRIKDYGNDLEQSIVERTRKLELANQELETSRKAALNIMEDALETSDRLKKSEERFELAMEATSNGLYDWNLETNEIYYSPGWKKMLGYDYNELPNDFSVWEKLTDPEDVKRSWIMQQELVNKNRDRFEIEFKMKHKDGHWVDVLSRAKAYFDDEGKAVRIVGTHLNISERKKKEQELLSSEEKHRQLLESTTSGIAYYDTKGRVLLINEAGAKNLGGKPVDFIGKYLNDFLSKEMADFVWQRMEQTLNSGKSKQYEDEMELAPGKMYLNSMFHPVLDMDNNIIGVQIVSDDITDRKLVEEKLRNNELSLRDAQHMAKLGSFTHHFEKDTLFWSEELYHILGYDHELPPPDFKTFLERVHPDDRDAMASQVERASIDGTAPMVTYRFYMQDGTMKYISAQTRVTFDASGKPEYINGTAQDITVLMTTEEELRTVLELNKNIVNTSPVGIAIYNHNGDCVEVNDATCEILGGTRDKLLKQNIHHINSWKESGLYNAVINTIKEKKKHYLEVEISTTFGKSGFFNFHIVPFDVSGQSHLLLMINDISDWKNAEYQLKHEKEKAQHYLDVASVMLIALDKEQNITLMNPAGCMILGYPENEIIGKNWFDHFIATDDLETVKGVFNKIISGDVNPVEYYENHVICKDGEQKLIAWHNSILKNSYGEIIGLFSSGEDITERRKAQDDLKEREARFKSVFESRLSGVLFWDKEGKITDANKAFLDLVGYTEDELKTGKINWRAMTPTEFHKDDDNALKELAQKGYITPFEKEYFHKEGNRIPIIVGAAALPGTTNDGVAFILDISDRKYAENELAKYREHLEVLVKERTAELEERNAELQRFHDATIDREFRIKELRDELDKLKKELE